MADVNVPRDAVMALMRASDRTRRAMVRVLQEFDLTLPQFNVLIILRREPELPTLEVATRLVEETPGITRLMNTLAAKRYIRRRRSDGDARVQLCSLTPTGRKLIDAVVPTLKAAQEAMLEDLSARETAILIELLKRFAV
jgi:DNA-binding MarR family transcriptional regulator